MARPEFKNTKVRLESGVEITDQLTAAFWFNIEDEELLTALKNYYQKSRDHVSVFKKSIESMHGIDCNGVISPGLSVWRKGG